MISIDTLHAGVVVRAEQESGKVELVVWEIKMRTGGLGAYVGSEVGPFVGEGGAPT